MTDRNTLLALAERVEAATENDSDLFRVVTTVVFGKVPDEMNAMLCARAFESAALLLLPDFGNRLPQLEYIGPNPNNNKQGHRVRLWLDGRRTVRGQHPTSFALALTAAALRALAERN